MSSYISLRIVLRILNDSLQSFFHLWAFLEIACNCELLDIVVIFLCLLILKSDRERYTSPNLRVNLDSFENYDHNKYT